VLRFNGTNWVNGDGSAIANLNASNIASGTLAGARLPAGVTKQVLQTVKTNTFSTTSTSFVNITGLSQAITPSSTASKILVIAQVVVGASASTYLDITGGAGTSTYIGDSAASRVRATAWQGVDIGNTAQTHTLVYLDDANTTSARTYQVRMRVSSEGSQTGFLNRSNGDFNNANFGRLASSITVMEIG
jgi:hypothetical protein